MCQNLWPDELKILIVDDEQETLNLIRLSLEPAGFRVLRTTKPEEGLALALREQPDLFIFDIFMPGLDGYELLRRIRRHPNLRKVPALIVSAQAGTIDQQRMLQLFESSDKEIVAYIGKPFDPAYLLQTVKEVLISHKDYLFEKNKSADRGWGRRILERNL